MGCRLSDGTAPPGSRIGSVLSALAPTLAGQNRYLLFSVSLSSFSCRTGTGMDGECLAAQTGTCRVPFLPVRKLRSRRLTPLVGGPGSVCVPGWIRHGRPVGDSLALWVLAVGFGPIFGTSCAGSTTFPRVQAAALHL